MRLSQFSASKCVRNPIAPVTQTAQDALSHIKGMRPRIRLVAARRNDPQIAEHPAQSSNDARQVSRINPFNLRSRCLLTFLLFMGPFAAALRGSLLQLQGKIPAGDTKNGFMIRLGNRNPFKELPRRPQEGGYGSRLFFFNALAKSDSPLAARSAPSQALLSIAHSPSQPIF